MPTFVYKAKKGPEEIVEGTVEAETQSAAVGKLTQMGYIPVKVEENVLYKGGASRGMMGFKKISVREVNIFTQQLASLISAKVELFKALTILAEQTQHSVLKEVIGNLRREVKDGAVMSDAMKKYPKVFSPLYINMIASGESGGVLGEVLRRLAEFSRKQEDIKSKIRGALAYPVLMGIVGAATVFFLIVFVMPRIVTLFANVGQVLPLPTRMLIGVTNIFTKSWYWAFGVIIVIVFTVKKRGFSQRELFVMDRLKLRLPLFGKFIKGASIAAFARTFSMLLANGIPVFKAIEVIVPTMSNRVFKEEVKRIGSDVIMGSSISNSMRRKGLFPPFVANMVAVGEESGSVNDSFTEIADFYERDVNQLVEVMVSLFEPLMILVLGLIVGFIVVSMLLPIFQINMMAR